jgi:hypothetical protein
MTLLTLVRLAREEVIAAKSTGHGSNVDLFSYLIWRLESTVVAGKSMFPLYSYRGD